MFASARNTINAHWREIALSFLNRITVVSNVRSRASTAAPFTPHFLVASSYTRTWYKNFTQKLDYKKHKSFTHAPNIFAREFDIWCPIFRFSCTIVPWPLFRNPLLLLSQSPYDVSPWVSFGIQAVARAPAEHRPINPSCTRVLLSPEPAERGLASLALHQASPLAADRLNRHVGLGMLDAQPISRDRRSAFASRGWKEDQVVHGMMV